mmetsp:Transcript_19155/g.24649  ORF Transcript_19155/g.24649 Transcript_19155/m.24649 type:complete len:253 (+) Transcript_19155:116-874(+)
MSRPILKKSMVQSMQSLRVNRSGKESLAKSLERRVEDLFQNVPSMELTVSRQQGNFEVRTEFDGDGGRHISVCQVQKVDNITPDDYFLFFDNFSEEFANVNPMVEECTILEPASSDDKEQREGVKVCYDLPFPWQNRVAFHYKYLLKNRIPNEHILILSNVDNQKLLEDHVTEADLEDYVLAHIFLEVYWVKPIKDDEGEIVGSSVNYAFSGDMAGSVPQWIQNSVAPKNAIGAVQNLLEFIQKKKAGGNES